MNEWIVSGSGRLDIFLAKNEIATSRIKASEMVRGGKVMVNGRIARKPAQVLAVGDKVQASKNDEMVTETRLAAEDLKLEVLYEDDACMVINKPAGNSVHPGAGMPADEITILHGIAFLFKERKIPFSSSSVLVHRLDKETTGCLLVAKTAKAHKELQMQFENRTVKKTYLAIVVGIPDPPSAIVDAAIGRSSSNRTKMSVISSAKTREARTTYRTLDACKVAALVACDLHTGRTHQIRVHMHAIGHPILGDDTYFSSSSEKVSKDFHIKDLCLHAWKLTFVSPEDKKEHAVMTPLPNNIEKVLKEMKMLIPNT